MTTEKMIEELLIMADYEGIREDVLTLANQLKQELSINDNNKLILEAYSIIKNDEK